MIGRSVGRYRILAPLGRGGMATVWRAEDPLLRRQVALKILAPELARQAVARRRFLNEAVYASRCDHPGIATIYDTGEQGEDCFIALAIVEGQTLAERLVRGPLPVRETLDTAAAVADALDHAHGRGVLHRDVTSRNVMVGAGGKVVLLDFGLALAADVTRLTSRGTTLGTLPYLAPEVLRDEPPDERSDLYGLGVVMYEALAGDRPFRAEHREALNYHILNLPPAPLGNVPAEVERLVLRLLAKERAMRPSSAHELLVELRELAKRWREAPELPGALPRTASATLESPGPPSSAPTESSPRRGAGPARLPDELYLAVLPFEDAPVDGDRSERSRFAHGWAHALSGALARIDGLHVIPPIGGGTTPETDLRKVARALGANVVLTGAVRRAGTEVRVSWTLVHPHRVERLGGGEVRGTTLDLFDLEDRLLAGIIAALGFERPVPEASGRTPRDPAARERYLQALGYLHRWENEASVDGAVAILERLLATEGESATLFAALARAYLYKFHLTFQRSWEGRAAHAAQRAQELAPDAPEVLQALGDLRTTSGQFQLSILDYRRALAVRSDHVEAWLGLAAASMGAGRRDEAERALQEAIRLQPDDWRAHNRLAKIHYDHGEYEAAMERWRAVIRLSPDNHRAHLGLAGSLHGLDRNEEALEAYRRSLQIQPTASAYTSLGTILWELGRHEEALEAFRSGVSMRPSDARVWGHLGSACRWLPGHEAEAGEALDTAIARMRETLSHHPGHPADWCDLASWLSNRGRFDEALDAITHALAIAPTNASCLAEAAAVHELAGRRAEAVAWAGKALRQGLPMFMLTRNPALTSLLASPEFQSLPPRCPEAADPPPADPLSGDPS